MRELTLFAIGAAIAGTIFMVSIVELFMTVRRRKAHETINSKLKELKTSYTESINKMVLEEEQKLQVADQKIEEVRTAEQATREEAIAQKEKEIEELKAESEKALHRAKERAHKLEAEAKQKAEDYLESRRDEVEHELMDLVMSVTKKVVPTGLSYEVHKEIVMKALQDVKLTAGKER